MTDHAEKMFNAVSTDNIGELEKILAKGVDIETRDASGSTALLVATHNNATGSAQLLIDAGADVNAMNDINDSPYLYAGAEGMLEILRMTLDNGADLRSVNRYGGTALIPAAHHGYPEIVRELLKTDIDIDHVNNIGWTALLEAVILGDGSDTYVEIVQLLVDAGADPEIADRDGNSPLDHALASGYSSISEILGSANSNN